MPRRHRAGTPYPLATLPDRAAGFNMPGLKVDGTISWLSMRPPGRPFAGRAKAEAPRLSNAK